jgi:hypothetical protein
VAGDVKPQVGIPGEELGLNIRLATAHTCVCDLHSPQPPQLHWTNHRGASPIWAGSRGQESERGSNMSKGAQQTSLKLGIEPWASTLAGMEGLLPAACWASTGSGDQEILDGQVMPRVPLVHLRTAQK